MDAANREAATALRMGASRSNASRDTSGFYGSAQRWIVEHTFTWLVPDGRLTTD